MQLPEMVRLVGKINGEDRVYMEDYVYTYLHDLKMDWEKIPIRVALFGHVYRSESRKIFMIYGAASVIEESTFSLGDAIKRLFYGMGVFLLTLAVTSINDYDKMYGFVEAANRAVIMAETDR